MRVANRLLLILAVVGIGMSEASPARAENFPVPFRQSSGANASGASGSGARVAAESRSPNRGAPVRRSPAANSPRDTGVRQASHTVDVATSALSERAPAERATLPLAPPKSRGANDSDGTQRGGTRGWFSTMTSLSIVVGAFLLLLYVARRHLPQGTRRLPTEAMESLGRMSLGSRQELHLVRVGTRLLVIGASPQGLAALGEVGDAEEVERLEQICRPGGSSTVSSSMRQALTRFEQDQRVATRRKSSAELQDV